MKRRHFLHQFPVLAASPWAGVATFTAWQQNYRAWLEEVRTKQSDPRFWEQIRSAYAQGEIIDLNSCGLSPTTLQIQESWSKAHTLFNDGPSRKSNLFKKDEKEARSMLANLTSTSIDELAICRNATEALATAIQGIPLQRGDEVIVGRYDYPHMKFAWQQRMNREGITLHVVDPGPCPASPGDVIRAYRDAVTPRTKAIFITDLINWNGCMLPTAEILHEMPDQVRYRIVDTAQSLAGMRDDWSALGATHIGASLHKWLGAPVGTGLLYIKEEFIRETWPLMAGDPENENVITKFLHLGTRDTTLYAMITQAVEFHLAIGHQRKKNRLLELADEICDRLHHIKNLLVISPRHPELRTQLLLVDKKDSQSGPSTPHIRNHLWKNHQIHTTRSEWEGIYGLRIAPNIFTNRDDIDRLLGALKEVG